MKLLEFFRREKTLQSVPTPAGAGRGGWFPIFESFTGAWQKNVVIDQDTVLAYFAIFSCVTLIAQDVSKLRVVRKERKRGQKIWQDMETQDPLLLKPNNYQNMQQFLEHWVISKSSTGNTYVLKLRDANARVVGLRILDPHKVRPLISDDGRAEVFYELMPNPASGLPQQVTVPASEILHDRYNCLYHPLVGVSPIYSSGTAAMHGHHIQADNTNFFANGGRPGGVITVPGNLSKDKLQEIKSTWEAGYSGSNAGKTAVLGDGMTYTPGNAYKATDSQVVEQLQLTAKIVAATFHVPLYKLGLETPSYDNVESLNQQYYSQCLQTYIEAIEFLLDECFDIDTTKEQHELDLKGLIRMDTGRRYDSYAKGIGAALLTPNEARAEENLPPVKGGDTPYMQQQNFSLAALDARDRNDPFAKSETTPQTTATPTADPAADAPVTEEDQAAKKAFYKTFLKGAIHE